MSKSVVFGTNEALRVDSDADVHGEVFLCIADSCEWLSREDADGLIAHLQQVFGFGSSPKSVYPVSTFVFRNGLPMSASQECLDELGLTPGQEVDLETAADITKWHLAKVNKAILMMETPPESHPLPNSDE